MDEFLQPTKKAKLCNSFSWIDHSFEASDNSNPRQRKHPAARGGKRKLGHAEKKSAIPSEDSWTERFKPDSKEDLAVHKKKISEVEDWLMNSRMENNNKQNSLLLLTGPAGTGKSTSIKILAKELNLDISEWSSNLYESSSYTSYTNEQNVRHNTWPNKFSENQSTIFHSFLLRAGKYPSLFHDTPRRLILVDEFPNAFIRDPTLFHIIIRSFYKNTRCPAVFIISDCSSGDSLENQLFPKSLQSELKIVNISFNPIAPTMLMKVLNRIISSLKDFKGIPMAKSNLEAIIGDCSGDLRNAINLLQFQNTAANKKNSSTKPKNSKKESSDVGGKDSSLFLFHALGKVLYCKRDTTVKSDQSELPNHLHHKSRHPLLSNPEEIFERTAISADGFSLFLHENYLPFIEDIEIASQCSESFSYADTLCTEWTSRNVMSEYSASSVARGLMFSLKPISSGNRWRPLKKPQYYSTIKNFRNSVSLLKNSFKESRLTLKELQTDYVPYLSKLRAQPKNKDQRTAILEIGRMSTQTLSRHHVVDSLSEKDVVKDDTTPVDDVIVSLSVDTEATDSAYVAESDEDYVIEDFDDDDK